MTRVTLAVAVLLGWFAAVYLYQDTPVEELGIGNDLTLAHLLIPVGFFCIALTNRRYGPTYAFAQVVATLAVVAVVAVLAGNALDEVFPSETIPSMRVAGAFAIAFFLSTFVSIIVFDGARGPNWWTAPLIALLVAAIIYPLAFYAWLEAGTGAAWFSHALHYMGVLSGEGLLLLIPFWGLRRMIPPVEGFGGY